MQSTYLAIDLKSFYASVECVERGLDPLTTNLVVADASRSEKTICLAATPALKAYGVPGRARLFEVVQKTERINRERKRHAPGRKFSGESSDSRELSADPSLALSYIVARPHMALYLEYSARVFAVYLRFVSQDDIHSYSVDEVFMDVTPYLKTYHVTAHELARRIIRAVLEETGITATAGIGTNLYLAKVAMDIVAKHIPADADGVRIAELDEMSYRRTLWGHRPITDFWRVGRGYARKLTAENLFTMGDIARCSLGKDTDYYNEELLYRLFGVNAELLIDHAWGYEPCTIAAIKAYRPPAKSLGSGQVLLHPYTHEAARQIVREMTEALVLDLVEKKLVTDGVTLDIGYDASNMTFYKGAVHTDHYGRTVPRPVHGSVRLEGHTSSSRHITEAVVALYERITDPHLAVRRVTVAAQHVLPEEDVAEEAEQLSLFASAKSTTEEKTPAGILPLEEKREKTEKSLQQTVLSIQKKHGKNAILKGSYLTEESNAIERHGQIGGHKA